MPPGWFGKKAIDEEGSANPGWLNEEADGEHVAAVAGADAGENATSAHDHDETSPLIADADEEEDDYDDSMEYGNSGYGAGSAHPDDEESSTSLTSSNWHEDDAIASPSLSSSRRSSSSRPKLGTGKKKVSTRTRMNEYKAKLEERRRKMLSGLPRRNCCHGLFIIINIIAVAACLLLILSQVLPIFFVKEVQTILQLTLRGYLTFFCLIFICAEMELPLPFVRSSQSLHNFISKGFNYTFVAIVAMEQAQADLVEESIKKRTNDPMGMDLSWFHALFVEIPAWVMLGVGALYMVMGILCMRPVRDRCREDYARRMEEYFETREALQRSLPPFEG